jgi:hypothetical protein
MSFEQLHTSILHSMGVIHNKRGVYTPKLHDILTDWLSYIIYKGEIFNKYVLDGTDIELLKPILLDYTTALVKEILKTRTISKEIIQLVGCGSLVVAIQHILAIDWMSEDESGLHTYLGYQSADAYTPGQIDNMGTCIHRMFDFLPYVTLGTNTNQCHIDGLFLKNIKLDSNFAELESMHKQAIELAKNDVKRVTRLILISKKLTQRKKMRWDKRKLLNRQRKTKAKRFFWKKQRL